MTPQILTIITSTSGVIGLLSLISYLYFSFRLREIEKSERSVKDIVEGEGLFKVDQVLQILREFKDDDARLNALKTFANISNKSAERVYAKIKGNVDVAALETGRANDIRRASFGAAAFFVIVAALSLAYSVLGEAPGPSSERIADVCGQPPGPTDISSESETKLDATIEAELKKLGPLSGTAKAEWEQKVRSSAEQIFRGSGESAQRRAEALFEYRACAIVVSNQGMTPENQIATMTNVRREIAAAQRENNARIEACVAERTSSAKEPQVAQANGNIRANPPGISGGTNRAASRVCALVPAGYELAEAPRLINVSCLGGRCSAGAFETSDPQSDGSHNVCVRIESWSDSKSFGGGGNFVVRLEVPMQRSIGEGQIRGFREQCGQPAN